MSQVLQVDNLSKKYKLYDSPWRRAAEWASLGRWKRHADFWALRDVSFDLQAGQCLGVIGHNGAGKSTLLKILSGTTFPTAGSFGLSGRVVSLLELGTGFNPELSGRQNLYNSGRLIGIPDRELKRREEQIVEFADIGEYIDYPVRTYSTGMYVRLAFSIFAHCQPDIYLVDEALAVGDIRFMQKCYRRIEELMAGGCALLFVSHDMQAVLKFCTSVMLMEQGRIIMRGKPCDVVDYYWARMQGAEGLHAPSPAGGPVAEGACPAGEIPQHARDRVAHFAGTRFGSRKVEIVGVCALDCQGRQREVFQDSEPIRLMIWTKANQDIDDLAMGFQITNRFGQVVFGQTSYMARRHSLRLVRGQILQTTMEFPCALFEGQYLVMVNAANCAQEAATEVYDCLEGCLHWTIIKPAWRGYHGVMYVPVEYRFMPPVQFGHPAGQPADGRAPGQGLGAGESPR